MTPSVPDFCEALTGYRHWYVDAKGYLCSANAADRRWPARKPYRAHCPTGGVLHFDPETGALLRAPRRGCSCGIYAYKTDGQQTWSNLPVKGEVKLWGRIIEHRDGYRAEFAYPSALSTADPRLAARLKFLYGVPCEISQSVSSRPDGVTAGVYGPAAVVPLTSGAIPTFQWLSTSGLNSAITGYASLSTQVSQVLPSQMATVPGDPQKKSKKWWQV